MDWVRSRLRLLGGLRVVVRVPVGSARINGHACDRCGRAPGTHGVQISPFGAPLSAAG